MKSTNPLHFKESIFTDFLKNYLGLQLEEFEDMFFKDLIYYLFFGEYKASVVYPAIARYLKDGRYDNELNFVSDQHKLLLHDALQQMGKEEKEHALLLEEFLIKKFGITISEESKKHFEQVSLDELERQSLVEVLVFFHIGEINFWTTLYFIYKNTEDKEIKKFFYNLLVVKSKHCNKVFQFFKLTKNDLNFSKMYFYYMCKFFRFFGFKFINEIFKLPCKDTEKDDTFTKLVYNNNWHKQFNSLFLKKSFKTFSLFYPNETFKSFFNKVNDSNREWLSI